MYKQLVEKLNRAMEKSAAEQAKLTTANQKLADAKAKATTAEKSLKVMNDGLKIKYDEKAKNATTAKSPKQAKAKKPK